MPPTTADAFFFFFFFFFFFNIIPQQAEYIFSIKKKVKHENFFNLLSIN